MSPGSVCSTATTPTTSSAFRCSGQQFIPARTVIGSNVWIGANCCIMGGAEIGDDAIVSAGSEVTGKVPPRAVALGNPAKVIYTRR